MKTRKQEIKEKCIIMISLGLLLIAMGLKTNNVFSKENDFSLEYEYINIKDIAETETAIKDSSSNIWQTLLTSLKNSNNMISSEPTEVVLNNLTLEETPLQTSTGATEETPKQVWRLPTEMGIVTQNPHYGHAALDIISPRGTNEYIFPVANGVISGIYIDPAGALVVTVLHNIDGVNYTSQYAHLSSFAEGIYVGKAVTVNDVLGRMGTTGYSTGVHLHLSVLDCALFDPNDTRCRDINSFINYGNSKVSTGYLGLGSHIYVPGSWDSR